MTEDTANETVNLIDDLLDIGEEMSQELQIVLEEMRLDSGDDSDGKQIADLIERWEQRYIRLSALMEAETEAENE